MSDPAHVVDALLAATPAPTVVQEKRERRVLRGRGPDGRSVYAKCGTGSKRREVLREAANARLLSERGFGPAVIASGERRDGAWLVTADVAPDAEPLGESLLAAAHRGPPAAARRAVEDAGRAVRAFHDAGFSFPDLTAAHAHLRRDRPHLWVIDVARLERHRGPAPVRARARDVGALLFSLELGCRPFTRAGRVRFVRAASGLTGDALRTFLRRVEDVFHRAAARTRWRHGFWWTDRGAAGERDVLTAVGAPGGDGAHGRITDLRLWKVVRTLPDRTNLRMPRDGVPRHFAKAYPPGAAVRSPAMREHEAIERFLRSGIPVNRVAAHTEDVERGAMLVVHACAGEPLDDRLRRGATPGERRALAVATARLFRRMRACGLRHRDAYPCHLFAAPVPGHPDAPRFDLRLIDLTRAGPAPFPKERWFVKDAAQFWHGMPRPPVTRTDAVRWLRAYFAVPRLTREAKRFARRVAAKERSISARAARKAQRERVRGAGR